MRTKQRVILILLIFCIVQIASFSATAIAATPDVAQILTAATTSTVAAPTSGGGLLGGLFSFIFEKILGPLLHIGASSSSNSSSSGSLPSTGISGGSHSGSSNSKGALYGKTILIDPGHGGTNPGSVFGSFRHSDNNLAVGLKVRDLLRQSGATVIMTRSSDQTVAPIGSTLTEELAARVAMAEKNQADLFISIHSNENNDTTIHGATTYYSSAASTQLAQLVQRALVQTTGAIDKGVQQANFYVIRNPSMPSILIEMGFMSNQEEAIQLNSDSYRNQIAQGIFQGISSYFNS